MAVGWLWVFISVLAHQKQSVWYLSSSVWKPISKGQNEVYRFHREKRSCYKVKTVCKTPHRVSDGRLEEVGSTILSNKPFEIGCHAVIPPYHVWCAVRWKRRELFKLCIFGFEIVENEKSKILTGSVVALCNEQGQFINHRFKCESRYTRDEVCVLKQGRVCRNWKEEALFHVLFAKQMFCLLLSTTAFDRNRNWRISFCHNFTVWSDEHHRVFQIFDDLVVLLLTQTQERWQLSEDERDDPRFQSLCFLNISGFTKSLQNVFSFSENAFEIDIT